MISMWKMVEKKEKSFVNFLFFYLIWIIWIVVLLFVVPSIPINDEKIRSLFIPFVVVVSWLVIYFLFLKLVLKDRPKYMDWKYVWKDGRVYEWEWENN